MLSVDNTIAIQSEFFRRALGQRQTIKQKCSPFLLLLAFLGNRKNEVKPELAQFKETTSGLPVSGGFGDLSGDDGVPLTQ